MKLVCYNIHKGTDEFKRDTLFQLINYLKCLDCDVICLQEVLHYQFIFMKMILRMDGVFGLHVDNKKMKFGICILSKSKITKSSHILLSSKKEQRGLLSIEVDNKVIIRTQKISPDQYIEKIELMGKALKKGKHNGTASIKAYDRKTDELVGEVAVDMIITSK